MLGKPPFLEEERFFAERFGELILDRSHAVGITHKWVNLRTGETIDH